MGDFGLPTVELDFGSEYRLVFDRAGPRHVMVDADWRTAALFPAGFGGQVVTKATRWTIGTEKNRLGWSVIAEVGDGADHAGRISMGAVPDTYRLSIPGGFDAHVTQNPLNGHWTISSGHHHLARVSDISRFARGASAQLNDNDTVGRVSTLGAPGEPPPLSLMIVLTLEMIKAIVATPSGGDAGASMIY